MAGGQPLPPAGDGGRARATVGVGASMAAVRLVAASLEPHRRAEDDCVGRQPGGEGDKEEREREK